SGNDALKLILEQEFSLIVLDVSMPEMDGFETAQLIRQRRSAAVLPIIFLSAREPDEADRRRGYSLGVVDYVTKPIVAEVLRGKGICRQNQCVGDSAGENDCGRSGLQPH